MTGEIWGRRYEYLLKYLQANLLLSTQALSALRSKSWPLCATPLTGPGQTCWIVIRVCLIRFSKCNHFGGEQSEAKWQVKFPVQQINIEGFPDRQTFRFFWAEACFDFWTVAWLPAAAAVAWLGRTCRTITPVSLARISNANYFLGEGSQAHSLVNFQVGQLNT